jgi:hypothetical protein
VNSLLNPTYLLCYSSFGSHRKSLYFQPHIDSSGAIFAPRNQYVICCITNQRATRSLTQDSSRRSSADASPLAALRNLAVALIQWRFRALPAARLGSRASHESLGSGS